MVNQSIYEARLAEQTQRRLLESLREKLFSQPTLEADPPVEDRLLEAEQELQRLEQKRMKLELAENHGLLLKVQTQPDSQFLGVRTTGIDATVLLRQSYVPTGVVHLLDPQKTPLVTFKIRYEGDEYTRIRVTSFVEDYSARSITTQELDKDNPQCEIHHLPTFFPDRIHQVTELTRATLHIQIDDLDKTIEQESTFPIWLLARTSAHLWIMDPAKHKRMDMTHLLGAWVTPNVPEVMHLLRRAADLHPKKQMVGYQADPQGVEEQVKAIFEALKEQGVHYINSTLCFGASRGEMMQRVRLPREALSAKSANCLDGTVLMASILEAATLNPAIVLVPGHAFLAWERTENTGDWDYLETTLIGTSSFENAHRAGRRQVSSRSLKLLPLPDLRLKFGVTPME